MSRFTAPVRLTLFGLAMTLVFLAFMFGYKAKAEPSPLPSPLAPHPFYLPLDEILPKELRDKAKKTKGKRIQADLGPDRLIDHRSLDSEIITQYRGDCTAQGLAAAGEQILARNGLTGGDGVSQESLWDRYKVYSADAAVNAWSGNLVKRESAWPFGNSTWKTPEEKSRYKLAEYEYLAADEVAALSALEQGYPVYAAMSVSRGMASCYAEIGPNSPPTSGGHALLFSGARVKDGKLSFLVKQQWGTNCGAKGYQWLPASVCDQAGAYCIFWTIKSVEDKAAGKTYSIKPTPGPTPTPTPSPAPSSAPAQILNISIEGVPFKCQKTESL